MSEEFIYQSGNFNRFYMDFIVGMDILEDFFGCDLEKQDEEKDI